MSASTLTRNDEIAARQIAAVAHNGLEAGDELAGTATVTRDGDTWIVTISLSDPQARRDYWVDQVGSELAIARHTGLLSGTFAVIAK